MMYFIFQKKKKKILGQSIHITKESNQNGVLKVYY